MMREVHGSDSESDDWPDDFDEFDDAEMEEVYRLVDSVNASPVKPTSSLSTPSAGSSARAGHIHAAFSQKLQLDSPSSATHAGSHRKSSSKAYSGSAMKYWESSESLSSEPMTDTESSLPSTRESSFSFYDSQTSSMSSVSTESSFTTSGTSRKRSLDSYDGSSSSTSSRSFSSPKMRRTSNVTTERRIAQPLFGAEDKMSPRSNSLSNRQQLSPPLDIPNIFRDTPLAPMPAVQNSGVRLSLTSSSATASNVTQLPTPYLANANPISRIPRPSEQPSIQESDLPDICFGVDLNAHVIAHSQKVQHEMDVRHISWGVQYEIARGVSRGTWKWEDVTAAKLDRLAGTEPEVAHKVTSTILSEDAPKLTGARSTPNLAIWKELNREQKAIVENCSRGLGLMGDWEGERDWFGGRIQQIARLVDNMPGGSSTSGSAPFTVQLEKLEMRRSSRFARFLGSRRILQFRVSDELLKRCGEKVRSFCRQKFIVCGRVFVPFHAKDGGLYMMETDENYERSTDPTCGDQHRMSLERFVAWANPLESNRKQPISKWSTRFALGLSTSVPALEFDSCNISFIKDEVANPHSSEKPPTHEIMTDGCGFINGAALAKIARDFKYDHRPTAIQGRIAGAKGLWILDPNDRALDAPPRLSIRDSQKKITFPDFSKIDRAHLIFDLVSPNRVTMPGHLSMQTIVNLSHNGVPDEVLTTLLKTSLEEEVWKLTDWDSPHAMHRVWDSVDKAGRITGTRLQRRARWAARAQGFGRDLRSENDDAVEGGDIDVLDTDEEYTCAGHEDYSGAPNSVFESAMELIQSGFRPLECKPLYDKLKSILTLLIDSYVKQYRIAVPQSAEVFCIPDPKGVLEEGEIYFRTTRTTESVTGPVLVSRNPLRVASDIQKVTAVNHLELADYHDVVIFSIKGKRSLASYLGGGDCDGDTIMVNWQPEIVDPFSNAEFTAPPDNLEENNFRREVESVSDFHKRVQKLSNRRSQEEFQTILLLGLADSKVGLYSFYHDMAVYILGYAHEETVRFAYMFTTCLDSSKTGLRVKDSVFGIDSNRFRSSKPRCLDSSGEARMKGDVARLDSSQPFILDVLLEVGEQERKRHLKAYDDLFDSLKNRLDSHLLMPNQEAEKKAALAKKQGYQGLKAELDKIRKHVREAYDLYLERMGTVVGTPRTKQGASKQRNDPFLPVARRFHEGPVAPDGFVTSNIEALKASYAYEISANFGFKMAFRKLCDLKAAASGPMESVTLRRDFAETMAIKSSFLRALAQNDDDDY